jgi:hypothetical protein
MKLKLTKNQKLFVENGVKNLIAFGYPNVNSQTIFTDYVYSSFFIEMLKENRNSTKNEELIADFNYLLELCYENRKEN